MLLQIGLLLVSLATFALSIVTIDQQRQLKEIKRELETIKNKHIQTEC